MSLQGTFNTAVQAMNAQSQALSNISTNIANTNTTAYKASDTHFQTLLNHTQPVDKSFFTVNTFDYRQVDKQGTISTTNRSLDLAINGRGFLVTNTQADGSGVWQYTRDGALFGKATTLDVDTDGNGANDQGTRLTTADGSYIYGWAAHDDGMFNQVNDLKALVPVTYSTDSIFPSKATNLITLRANISAANEGRQNVSLPFVDQEGNSRSLSVGFTSNQDGNWTLDMAANDTNNQPVQVTFDPPNLSFNGTGNLVTPADGLLNVTVSDVNGPQSFTLEVKNVTQFADNGALTVNNVDQDGYIQGRLQKVYFNDSGVLIGSYTNGEVKNLFKLPVATFAADGNLEAKPGNIFVQTSEAGAMQLNGLGQPQGTTQIVAGALEQSNVDLADQFSKMIVTQRAYSSAAKVLTTADEMTQAARDLKR